MKNLKTCIGIILLVFQVTFTTAQTTSNQSIADKVVNQVLEVQPGEVVMIQGTPSEIDMFEDYIVAIAKAGGKYAISLEIPKADKKAIMAVSMEHLKIPNTFGISMIRNVDCIIRLRSIQDPLLFADIPTERMVALQEANKAFNSVDRKARYRQVSVGQDGGIPSKAFAKSANADYQQMIDVFWKSVNVDYSQIARKGKQLTAMMKKGSQVKITSPHGTEIQFAIGKNAPGINSGRTADNTNMRGPSNVWLPAGEVFVAIDPTSANGKIVVPNTDFRGNKIKNLKMEFKGGKMISMTSDSNIDDLKKYIQLSGEGVDVLSLFDIGLNEQSQPLKGSDYTSWEMAGVVSLGIGGNSWAGGDLVVNGAFDFRLTQATLSIDGKTVVKDGQLQANKISK